MSGTLTIFTGHQSGATYEYACDCGATVLLYGPGNASTGDGIPTLMAEHGQRYPGCPHAQRPPALWIDTWERIEDAEAELRRGWLASGYPVFEHLTRSAERRCPACCAGFQTRFIEAWGAGMNNRVEADLLHACDCPVMPMPGHTPRERGN